MRSSEADVTRTLGKPQTQPHGRVVMGDEPPVFHCNYYNYFLQKTLRLDETLEMDAVIVGAAEAAAYAQLRRVAQEIGATTASERTHGAGATSTFSGFRMTGPPNVLGEEAPT